MAHSYESRGRNLTNAALFFGIDVETFESLVAQGKIPQPRMLGTTPIWDVHELDDAFTDFFETEQ